jgi:hypothetical protein
MIHWCTPEHHTMLGLFALLYKFSSYTMPALYEEVGISELAPGPRRVSFTGRIVNMYDQSIESKMPKAAKGCLKLVVKDDHAMMLVRSKVP